MSIYCTFNCLYILRALIRGGTTLGQGAIAPETSALPQYDMKHCLTVFDELTISAYRCKMERSVAFKIPQNAFPTGAPLWTNCELTTLPDSLVGWGGVTPPHTLPHLVPLAPRCSGGNRLKYFCLDHGTR